MKNKRNSDNKENKYIEIAMQLKSKIDLGEYKEGDKIPTIKELSQIYQLNPQTINKAIAYLASLGYITPRRGVGSIVNKNKSLPRKQNKTILMLVDKHRSKLLNGFDSTFTNYHAKDIYLSYLLELNRKNLQGGFIVYDKDSSELSDEFIEKAESAIGFIVQGTLPEIYIEFLAEKKIPTVFINRDIPVKYINKGKLGSILIDNHSLEQVANYLVSLGHLKILYLLMSEFEENEVFHSRIQIVRKVISSWSKKTALEIFKYDPSNPECINSFYQKVINENFTAGIGYNDICALGTYTLAKSCGIEIPNQFSVVGFDDIIATETAVPPLTTIRVNRAKLSTRAIEILELLSKGKGNNHIKEKISTEIIFRQSVIIPTK